MFLKLGRVPLGTKSVLRVSVKELPISTSRFQTDASITYTLDELLSIIADDMLGESDLAVAYSSVLSLVE